MAGEQPESELDGAPDDLRKTIWPVVGISLVTNLLAAGITLGGAASTESTVLLGAGLVVTAEAGAQVGLLAGRWRDRRVQARSAAYHPLDSRRHQLFWFFAPGLVLLALAAAITLGVGIDRLAHPLGPTDPDLALGLAAAALAAKVLSLAVAGLAVHRDLPPHTYVPLYLLRASRPDPVLMVRQDVLAAAAQLVAVGALTAVALGGAEAVDPGGAVALGGLTVIGACLHMAQMKAMLVASPAGRHQRQSITAAIEIEPSVVRLAHLEVYHLGPEELLVGVKVDLIDDLHASELADTVRRLADSIRRTVPTASVVYVEPDAPNSTSPEDAGPLRATDEFASGGTYPVAGSPLQPAATTETASG